MAKHKRTPCEFTTIKNPELRATLQSYSRIAVASEVCVQEDPFENPYNAFLELISLLCVVSESLDKLPHSQNTSQLDETVQSLRLFGHIDPDQPDDALQSRIETYVDAATKICTEQAPGGNPIVEIVV